MFNMIAALLTSILKTIRLSNKSVLIIIRANVNKVIRNSDFKAILPWLKKAKMIKSILLTKPKNLANSGKFKIINIINIKTMRFLIFKAKVAFI